MKIKSLLSMASAMLFMTSAMAQSKTLTTTSAGTLAGLLTDDEKASVKELVVTGPLNKTDFNFINTLAALETLDIKAATIAEETLDGTTYPADELPKEALSKNLSIKTLVLPSSVVSIGDNAVYLTMISNVDFSACSNLKTIVKEAFYCNDYLATINLSGLKSLETIGVNAFNTCGGKATTDTPVIDLSGCSNLKEIDDYAFCNIKLNANINLSGCTSLTRLGVSAFQNVYTSSADLSECMALETIGVKAFYTAVSSKAKMTTIKLPAALKTIGDQAFNNQKTYKSVTILAVAPPTLGTKGFYATDGAYNATLTVPVGSKAAYEANEEWKKFKEIVEADGSSVKEFEAAETKIWGADNTIYVVNAEEGANVNVYDLSGALVASATVSNGSATLRVSAKGLYLIKAATATAKIRL